MDSTIQGLIGLAGSGIIIALVQGLVKPFVSDERFYPLASVLFGIILNVGLGVTYATGLVDARVIVGGVVYGILAGLAASGAYSATQTKKPLTEEEALRILNQTP